MFAGLSLSNQEKSGAFTDGSFDNFKVFLR